MMYVFDEWIKGEKLLVAETFYNDWREDQEDFDPLDTQFAVIYDLKFPPWKKHPEGMVSTYNMYFLEE